MNQMAGRKEHWAAEDVVRKLRRADDHPVVSKTKVQRLWEESVERSRRTQCTPISGSAISLKPNIDQVSTPR